MTEKSSISFFSTSLETSEINLLIKQKNKHQTEKINFELPPLVNTDWWIPCTGCEALCVAAEPGKDTETLGAPWHII